MSVTSADCKACLVRLHPQTKASDWKRRSRRSKGEGIVERIFENIKTGEMVEVVERFGQVVASSVPKVPEASSGNPVLDALRANPIKVDFTSVPKETGFSGRVIYDGGDEDGSLFFICGLERDGGYLDDRGEGPVDDMLNKLFTDFPFVKDAYGTWPSVSIGDSEGSHSVQLIPGISKEDLWDVIKARLVRSGAVPFGQIVDSSVPTSGNPVLDALRANPIKVDLVPLDYTDFHRLAKEDELEPDEIKERLAEFSGRVVYALENYTEAELTNAEELCFTCGPEADGWLDDSDDLGTCDKLKTLFADFPTWGSPYAHPGVDVWAAENFHEVEKEALEPHGISFKDAWEIVKARLERSGAVQYEGGGGG